MNLDEHYRKLERMYQSAPINQFFRPRLTITEGQAEVVMEVRPDFFHAAHAAHGALYFKGLDDAAFFATNSLVPDFFVLTISFTTYLERPVSQGTIRCQGRVVMAAKKLFIAESRILDHEGREIARGSGNFVKSGRRLTPEIGYA
ncbi:MAG: PaaI family thioesterase [Desulfarculus sp.]|nr:PaaI family thioesterase [Desulfarculus sp.]